LNKSKSTEKKLSKKLIYIFWHTYLEKGYEKKFDQIIRRQLSELISSKIINHAIEINVTVSPKGMSFIKNSILRAEASHLLPKFKFHEITIPYHEGVTLCKIKKISDNIVLKEKKGFVLYFHTKGSSYHPYYQLAPIDSWTKMMEYFNIRLWQNCLKILDKYHTCGCEIWSLGNNTKTEDEFFSSRFKREYWHYSGNFWWARMDYIANLLNPPEFFLKDDFNLDRKLSEFWILSSIGFKSSPLEHYPLHYTGQKYKRGIVHHYLDCYPFKYYSSGKQQPYPKLRKLFFSGEVGFPYNFLSKLKNALKLIIFKIFGKKFGSP